MRRVSYLLALLALVHAGCQRTSAPARSEQALDDELTRQALHTYADIAHASYHDSVQGARTLLQRIEQLLTAPSEASLAAAREAWLAARVPYAQSEVFRFYDGPIDALELTINTWPIDESFVESAAGEQTLGIVQDVARYPQLSRELLVRLNGQSETSISTGYHVIEFLLWGRDENPDGPGQRSAADYVVAGDSRQAQLVKRRGEHLRLASQLLLEQLTAVRDAWKKDADNYRRRFLSQPPERALYWALKGMGKLSGPELAGERMTVAYETKDQESEHSCFSDSTHADLMGNARGIQNVCTGRYRGADNSVAGVGICDVLARARPALAGTLRKAIDESVDTVRSIPAPFDQAILGDDSAAGRRAIQAAIASLRRQAELLEQTRRALSLSDASGAPGAS